MGDTHGYGWWHWEVALSDMGWHWEPLGGGTGRWHWVTLGCTGWQWVVAVGGDTG